MVSIVFSSSAKNRNETVIIWLVSAIYEIIGYKQDNYLLKNMAEAIL